MGIIVASLDFDLTVEADADGGVRITVRGELDLATAPRLRDALADPGGRVVLVDLRGLTFMDSTGVRTLLQANEDAASAGSELRFLLPRDGGARLTITETGIERILPTADPPP
jgi:anti-anti-sigma factor